MNPDPIEQARDMARAGEAAKAVALLEEASQGGNAAASLELALWFLRGDAVVRDVARAREFTLRGAEQGHDEAILLEIALAANGGGGPVDWSAALALLRRSADDRSWLRGELALVDRLPLNGDGYPERAPQAAMIEDRINLFRFEGFLSAEERQHIANITVRTLEPSTVFDPKTGKQISDPIRSSEGTVIGPTQEDMVIQAVNRRIAAATGATLQQGEPISVLRYSPGQQYKPHYDAIHRAANNRIKTLIIYLNDGYIGGQTAFPDLDLVVEPRAGDAIVFDNLTPDGSLLRASRHAGLPVTQGTKWVATRWIRQRAFDPWSFSPAGD